MSRIADAVRGRHYLYLVPEGPAQRSAVTHKSFDDDDQAGEWARGQQLTEGARRWTMMRMAGDQLVTVESSEAAILA